MAATQHDRIYQQIAAKIAPLSTVLRTWSLTGGISAGMTAVEIALPNGQTKRLVVRRPAEAALRRNPRAAEDEFELLRIARSLGLPAPIPIAVDASGVILPTPYLVTGYVEGRMEFAPADPLSYADQMAACLAQIHSIDGARADLSFLPRLPGDAGGLPGELPRAADPAFEEARLRATVRGAWPFPARNPPALLHGDFWPGNILWQGRRLAAVIDWEDAHTGDPLSDLAIARLDMLWIVGRDAMHAFTRRYQASMALDMACLPYWDLWAALRLVRLAGADLAGWAAYFHPYGRPDITAQSIREHLRDFTAQAYAQLAQRGPF